MTERLARYDFPSHVKGDTFDGVLFTITVNGVALDLNGANTKIAMDLRLTPLGDLVKTYDTNTNGGITIYNPSDGSFVFDAQIIDLAVANYYYAIEITLHNGVIKTYISGRWNILQDVTYGE